MRAVWSWLRELVELDQDISAEQAAQAFTNAGLEVESVETIGAEVRGVVIAEVVGKRKHPQADRLTLVDVIDQPGGPVNVVVCGASNVPEPGGRVLWARPGAVLPGMGEIGKRTFKGIESPGMLCAEDELGMGEDHSGIMVIEDADLYAPGGRAQSGSHASDVLGSDAMARLGLRDTVLEISVHANRPDALGQVGLARELAAILGGRLEPIPGSDPSVLGELDLIDTSLCAADLVDVAIDDPHGCPRYVARVIDGLTVARSPYWMRQRLRAVGVRPLSNLVDITNYVMFELGQPLHAFDYSAVRGAAIRVRRARAGERMTTLDQVERTLEPSDLLICDAKGPVALAGVMGGASSEVSEHTTRVLLEAAGFEPQTIRSTARRLGMHSEASHRFERGVDPNIADAASVRASWLLARLGKGRVAAGAVDAYVRRVEPWTVSLRASRASMLTGVILDRQHASELLARLGITVESDADNPDLLHATCPTYRSDLTREEDLIEEVIRIYGLDNMPATLPMTTVAHTRQPDKRPMLARRALAGVGMCEAIMFGFTSQARIDALRLPPSDPRAQPLRIRNPMSVEQAVMRTSLMANLLGAVARNVSFGITDVGLFEIGSVFVPRAPGELPDEPVYIAGVMTGSRPGWMRDGGPVDFYDSKGAVERLLAALLGRDAARVRFASDSSVPYLHPGICASVTLPGGALAGHVGEVHPDTRRAFGLEAPCFAFELALAAFPQPTPAQMGPIPRFPAVTRDISLFVDEYLPAGDVLALIEQAQVPLMERVTVLEEYRDPQKVPAGKKGLLWSITYRSHQSTLTDAEVDSAHEAIVARLVAELPAERR